MEARDGGADGPKRNHPCQDAGTTHCARESTGRDVHTFPHAAASLRAPRLPASPPLRVSGCSWRCSSRIPRASGRLEGGGGGGSGRRARARPFLRACGAERMESASHGHSASWNIYEWPRTMGLGAQPHRGSRSDHMLPPTRGSMSAGDSEHIGGSGSVNPLRGFGAVSSGGHPAGSRPRAPAGVSSHCAQP